jgi:hypothetical protein
MTEKIPPTLLVHGKDDTVVPYSNSERLNRALDNTYVAHKFGDSERRRNYMLPSGRKLSPLSDINMIVELKGNELSFSDLDLYAEAFKTVEIYDELAFLRLMNVNDSLLGAAGDVVISVAGVHIVFLTTPVQVRKRRSYRFQR